MINKSTQLFFATATFAVVGAFVALTVHAQEYLYVDTTGELEAQVALGPYNVINSADDIAVHSGVIMANMNPVLATEADVWVDSSMNTYKYVDTNGTVRTVRADSAADALVKATDRDPNSGVLLVQ